MCATGECVPLVSVLLLCVVGEYVLLVSVYYWCVLLVNVVVCAGEGIGYEFACAAAECVVVLYSGH